MKRFGFSALLAGVLSFGIAGMVAAAGNGVEGRIESIGKLVNTSSAARKIQGSDSTQAKAGHARALSLYEQARAAHARGDAEAANALLHEAAQTMFAAVRLVDVEGTLEDKRRADYEARLESIEALRDAYARITEEKGVEDSNATLPQLEKAITEARALSEASEFTRARARLDEAYLIAKTAIEKLRGGETLVRTLHFETKEDEYHYELDRNDTHRMLVDVLLQEKRKASSALNDMVHRFLDKAGELRRVAESQADRGDYDAAVRSLEDSTREIVRAIRGAGVYIPG